MFSPGIQRSISAATRAAERFAHALLAPATVEPSSGPAPRPAAAAASTRFESDEELARRLQEQEFRAEEARQRGSRPNPAPAGTEPRPLDASELRRRRLARLGR